MNCESLRAGNNPAFAQWRNSPALSRAALLCLLGIVLLASWGLGIYFLGRAKTAAISAGEARAQALARAFAEHTLATVKLIDASLDGLGRSWVASPVTFPEDVARLRAILKDVNLQIGITDRDGWAVYSALNMAGRHVNVRDLEHINTHLVDKRDRLFVATKPTKGRISGRWTIQFSRPIFRNGKVDGVAVIGVDPLYFSRFYESLHLANRDVVAMARGSGTILARLPFDETLLGIRLLDVPFTQPDSPVSGVFQRRSQADGVDRLYAYYRIPEYDLAVVAGLDEQELFRSFHQIRMTLLLSLSVITALSILGVLNLMRRLSDREQYTAALLEANTQLDNRVQSRTAELRRTLEEMRSFSYSVAHDLKAPLRAVGAYSSMLLAQAQGGGKNLIDVGMLAKIVAACARMGAIVEGLLLLAHISRQPIQIRDLELGEKATEIVEDLRAQSSSRTVKVTIQPDLKAQGDEALIRIVLQNLLGNAWKFTSRTPAASIEFGYSENEQAFYVRDNGAGFDLQYAAKLFQPFARLHGEKEYPGSGIGLVTTQRIITRLGGRIWADAVPGHGATFWFTLPPCKQAKSPATRPRPTANAQTMIVESGDFPALQP